MVNKMWYETGEDRAAGLMNIMRWKLISPSREGLDPLLRKAHLVSNKKRT
jgi:hypothetical protein